MSVKVFNWADVRGMRRIEEEKEERKNRARGA
jgi:hypothetical protein